MYKTFLIFSTLFFFYLPSAFAIIINTTGVAVIEDFNGFDGTGFAPTPAIGQLDSDDWRITGLSDGDGSFGGTYTSDDFARGTDPDGVTTGGIYSFDVDNNSSGINPALGVQPGGSDFTPGTITLKVINNTASALTSLLIAYDIFIFNDKPRASSFNFSYSFDDNTYTNIPAADFLSPAGADSSPSWVQNHRSVSLSGLNILNSTLFYLQWSGNDVSGSGSRDQFSLDNISITGFSTRTLTVTEPSTIALMIICLLLPGVRVKLKSFYG